MNKPALAVMRSYGVPARARHAPQRRARARPAGLDVLFHERTAAAPSPEHRLDETLRVSAPRQVFGDAVTEPMTDSRRHADYTPDGQRMLARQRHGALEPPVRLIINWAEPPAQP